MSLGDLLASAGDTPHDVRVGRVLNAFLDRRARGRSESEQQFFQQHPNLASDLRLHLDTLRELKPERGQIAALIQQGLLRECDDPAYPARLGPFKVSRVLGHGGMGVVLRAYEQSLDREVALKLLRPELTRDERALRRFTREAKAAAAINHPNIVTIHAVGEEDGVHYLAMELVEGPTLADVIRARGPLPTESVRSLFRQLLAALAAAHEAGLIHRDVKASNILLEGLEREGSRDQGIKGSRCVDPPASRRDHPPAPQTPNTESSPSCLDASVPRCLGRLGRLKLADFGLARMMSSQTRLTRTDSPLGTPQYMSPEQARGDADIDHRTDLYSAGVVLYEMLTGRTPFRADTPTAVIHQILHDKPPEPAKLTPGVDSRLAALALRMMAKAPQDRLASAAEVLRALDANQPVRPLPRRRVSRRVVVAGLIASTVIASGIWVVWRYAAGRRTITAIRVDPYFQHGVEVQYGDDASWQKLPLPPEIDPYVVLNKAVVVGSEDDGGQIVVVAAAKPLDTDNNVLAAFDWNGTQLSLRWQMPLHSDLQWPDCPETPRAWWSAKKVISAQLNGEPDDRIVVVANDPDYYPTRVSIIDPRSGPPDNIRHTFWHFGQRTEIEILKNFFGKGRPAILAWGVNNKLDGFGDPPEPGDEGYHRYTKYPIVPVVMILDPRTMDGLGPPRTQQAALESLKSAMPFAYACLDLSQPATEYATDSGTELPEPWEIVDRWGIKVICPGVGNDPASWRLTLRTGVGVPIIVDGNLGLLRVKLLNPAHKRHDDKAFWEARWKPIIQNREYVE